MFHLRKNQKILPRVVTLPHQVLTTELQPQLPFDFLRQVLFCSAFAFLVLV